MIYQFVVSFLIGIVFEKFFGLGWPFGILVFSVSLFLFAYLKKENIFVGKIFFVIGVAFAFGVLRMTFVDFSPDQNLYELVGQKISFEATISDEPDVRDTSVRYVVKVNQNSLSGISQKCLASATGASTRKNSAEFYPCIFENSPNKNFDSLVLLVADRYPEFKYGDQIKVSGKLDLPKNFKVSREALAKWDGDNGLSFDYISYLAKDKIHFLIYYPIIQKTDENTGNKLVSFLFSLKNIFIEKISAVVPEPNSSFLAGIIFGVKQSLGQELLNDFKTVGLIHIVVLSGYNITIIAVGIFYLTSFLRKRNIGFVLSLIFIILFATMVGWGATVLRAVIMSLISILALFLGRPADALRWLFIAGFLMLFWNPLVLFYDPSFQLSFMATLGLILFSEPIDKKFISQLIKILIKIGVPVSFIVGAEKMKMREIISSTLAVQLFVLPLLIKMSGFVSVISFLINPIVLPLVPWTMGAGALTGALGLMPFVGKILSWPVGVISYALTQIIISLTEFSASLPFATLQTGSIPLWLILVWYAGYVMLFWKLKTSE